MDANFQATNVEALKLSFLRLLAGVLNLPGVRGRVTVSEFFFRALNLRNPVVSTRIGNCRLQLDLSQQEIRYIYFGAYECAERKFLKRFLRKGDVAVDVGANYGYLSALIFNAIGREGKLYAFEPNPEVYKCLELIKSSSNGSVETYMLAVSSKTSKDASEMVNFYINPQHTMWASTLPDVVGGSEERVVRAATVTLSDFFAAHGIERVDFLKIDVEGAEAEVLEGLLPYLEGHLVRAMMCEISPVNIERWTKTLDQIRKLLTLGYQSYKITPSGSLAVISLEEICELSRTENVVFAFENDVKSRL